MNKEKPKEKKDPHEYVMKYFLRWFFLIVVFLSTYYLITDWLPLAVNLSQRLFYVLVYTGGGFALLKMGDWI
ncbi:MAG: hypothetical protein ACP5D2_03485 [Candidatus Nanoarchaeia archaeon]